MEAGDDPRAIPFFRSECSFLGHMIALDYFLADEPQLVREWATKTLCFVDDEFFGEWRERIPSGDHYELPPNRGWWNKHASWRESFVAAIVWCAVLGDWDRLEHVASYVTDDIEPNVDQTPADRAWLQIAAGTVRQRPKSELQPMIDVIHLERSKREKFLLAWLLALGTNDATAVQKAAKAYAEYFLKSEVKKFEIPSRIMIDGSFLYHYSVYRGFAINLGSKIMEDHLIVV